MVSRFRLLWGVWIRRAGLPVCLFVLLSAAACSENTPPPCADRLGCVDIGPDEPFKLGVIQALSGNVATLGQEQIRGLELALARRNGQLLGHDVRLILEDSGCTPEGGANAALRIVADHKVVAIFGSTCSASAALAAEVMSRAGLVMVSGNNSASYLTSVRRHKGSKWQAGFMRTAPNEEFAGPAAARFAFEKLGVRKAALIDDGDLYTTDLAQGFRDEFVALGGEIVFSGSISRNDLNMEPILTAVRSSGAELLFFPLFQPDGNHLLKAARNTPGLEQTNLMSSGSLVDASFLEDVGQDAAGMFFVAPAAPEISSELDRLISEYAAMFGTTPSNVYYVNAFDGASLLLDALEKCAERLDGGIVRIGRQHLRDILYATQNASGVYGPVTCNEFGDCAAQRFEVLRCDDHRAGLKGLTSAAVYVHLSADQ